MSPPDCPAPARRLDACREGVPLGGHGIHPHYTGAKSSFLSQPDVAGARKLAMTHVPRPNECTGRWLEIRPRRRLLQPIDPKRHGFQGLVLGDENLFLVRLARRRRAEPVVFAFQGPCDMPVAALLVRFGGCCGGSVEPVGGCWWV